MGKTMHWQAVPGVVHIVVHTDTSPDDEEWDAYLEDAAKHVNNMKGGLVYTHKVGPTASQRSRAVEKFKEADPNIRMAIMAGSRLVIGIVTAFSWVVESNIKAFSTKDFEAVANWLDLDFDERLRVRVTLRQLARSAGRNVDAFADESGRFRRKLD